MFLICQNLGRNILDNLTVVLEMTLESPLDNKEINQSILKEINTEYLLEGLISVNIHWTDAEAEAPVLWPPDVKSQLTGKDPGARKD